MFEDSTFESRGSIHTRSRGWSLAALTLNSAVLMALVLIPLIYPEALPRRMMNLLLTAPPAPAAPQPAPVREVKAQPFHGAPQLLNAQLTAPRQIPKGIAMLPGPEEQSAISTIPGIDNGVPHSLDVFRGSQGAPAPAGVMPKTPTHISSGVAEGLLLSKTLPVYPAIARAMRAEGTVMLHATISRQGAIENLQVVSGPAVLRQAAIDAVKSWRYRPFLLNGDPVEVDTTINVVFRMGP